MSESAFLHHSVPTPDQCPVSQKDKKEKKKKAHLQIEDGQHVISSDEESEGVSVFQQYCIKEIEKLVLTQKSSSLMHAGSVLLDSASSCDIFGEGDLLCNVLPTSKKLRLTSNGGKIMAELMGLCDH